MGEVVWGVDFTAKARQQAEQDICKLFADAIAETSFADDVFYMSAPVQPPSDTEPSNEPA